MACDSFALRRTFTFYVFKTNIFSEAHCCLQNPRHCEVGAISSPQYREEGTNRMFRKTMVAVFVLSMPGASIAQDSYVCSKASLEERFTLTQKSLEDPFGFSMVDVRGVALLCSATTSSAAPDVHQVSYKAGLSKDTQQVAFERSDHILYDQFGAHPLSLIKPDGVRAPSAMAHGGGGTPMVDTSGVDHFQCYKAAPSRGAEKFIPPPPFVVEDGLSEKTISISKIGKVCAPANVNGDDPSAPGHLGHLVCYRARLESGAVGGIVSIDNESFGDEVLELKSLTEFCVPALMDMVP